MAARIKKGDTVMVCSGKDKGKTGTVLRVLASEGKVVVEGVNLVTKHVKPTQAKPKGEKLQKEAPIASCKVMPVHPETGKATRVRFQNEDGKKVRVTTSRKAGTSVKLS